LFRRWKKKSKNQLNQENWKKNKKTELKKSIKLIKILKKPVGSIWFWFYKQKTKKTEPNQIETKKNLAEPSQIEKTEPNQKNQAKPVWTGFCPKKPNQIEPKPSQTGKTESNRKTEPKPKKSSQTGLNHFFP